jgi:hypothetical protein
MVVRLQPTQSVGGVVVDAGGQPVVGAMVIPLAGMAQPHERRRAITDRQGRFRLGGMGSQSGTRIVALAVGFAPAVEQLDLRAGGRDDVRIVLRRGRLVHGRVTDLDDRPVAQARVRFAETTERDTWFPPGRSIRASPSLVTETRADGYFEIAGVLGGFWDVTVDAVGYAITAVPGWEIAAGDGNTDLGLIRVGPGVVIDGIVVEGATDDGGDTPLAGAAVRVEQDRSFSRIEAKPGSEPWSAWLSSELPREPMPVVSGADGRFSLRDLNPSEKVALRASLEGYVPAFAPGVRGPTEQPVRLVLERGATVTGRVVDENGEAVPRAGVGA